MNRQVRVEIADDAYWRRQIKCQSACPVNTDARGYVQAIAAGDDERGYLVARAPNPLASICGRVCGALCETECRRGAIDAPISVRGLKRFVTERFGSESGRFEPLSLVRRVLESRERQRCRGGEELPAFFRSSDLESRASPTGEKVAIIGSGPGGLAAAHDLALMGFRPTIYEVEPIPAGMLAIGIPGYRLPRDLIEGEIEVIRALGVEIVCNTEVGKDISLAQIRAEYPATLIAVGAKRSRTLPIPGHDAEGVLGGVELLRDVALKEQTSLGGRVVVVGGGNVAYDVARTVVRQTGVDISRVALRQSTVREVHLCCLESLDAMPADDTEIIEGDQEGIFRHNSVGPIAILTNDANHAIGVSFKRVLSIFDDNGRFAPTFDEDDVTTIEADTVIWAVGQQTDLSFLESASDIRVTERGLIECTAETLQASAADIFVAGDVAYGTRFLIDAVASGKRAARSIYRYLAGKDFVEEVTTVHVPQRGYCREYDYEKIPRVPIPTADVSERTLGVDIQVEQGYTAEMARTEASRCLDCAINTIFDSAKCILCGGCVDVCPEVCLRIVRASDAAQGAEAAEAVAGQLDDGAPDEASAILKDETKCIRCALCAERCPVGAITMERFEFQEVPHVSKT